MAKKQKKQKKLPGLPISLLLRNTPNDVTLTAREVKISDKKFSTTKSGLGKLKAKVKSKGRKNKSYTFEALGFGKDRVFVSCSCVIGSTRVLTDRGWETVHSLLRPDLDPIKDQPYRYQVNGKYYSGSAPFYTGKRKVWKLTLCNGLSITATKDHRFLEYTGLNHNIKDEKERINASNKWTELRDLKVGSKIMVNQNHDLLESTPRDWHFWESYFMGAFFGDGTLNPPSLAIKSHPGIVDYVALAGIDLKLGSNNQVRHLLDRRGIELLRKYGVDRRRKRHHIDIDRLNLYGFLSGLLDTDGSVKLRRSQRIGICGGKELQVIRDALISIGVPGISLRLARKKGTRTNKGVANRDMFLLRISQKGLDKLEPNMDGVKIEQFRQHISDRAYSQNRVNYTRIVGIQYMGRNHVYDINVPETSSFVAESVIVHNCDFFLYNCEYALTQYGASGIRYSNGEPARIKNPNNIPYLCKHGFRIFIRADTIRRLNSLAS